MAMMNIKTNKRHLKLMDDNLDFFGLKETSMYNTPKIGLALVQEDERLFF
jgi:hypothetical protein